MFNKCFWLGHSFKPVKCDIDCLGTWVTYRCNRCPKACTDSLIGAKVTIDQLK